MTPIFASLLETGRSRELRSRCPLEPLLGSRMYSTRLPVDSLFRCFAVEVFVVGFRFGAGMVDDAVPMIRRRIERIELQWNTAGIDDVVIRPSRDDYREARSDRRPNTIKNRLTGPLLYAKELVERVHLHPNLLLGLQRHDDELAVLCRVKHPAKLIILDGETLDVLYKAFHNVSFRYPDPQVRAFDIIQNRHTPRSRQGGYLGNEMRPGSSLFPVSFAKWPQLRPYRYFVVISSEAFRVLRGSQRS